jgi:hypothetical protein
MRDQDLLKELEALSAGKSHLLATTPSRGLSLSR